MSSWDRSRSIPWSRVIPVASPSASESGQVEENVDLMRERVWRDLAREAANDARNSSSGGGGSSDDAMAVAANDGMRISSDDSYGADASSSSSSSFEKQEQQQQARQKTESREVNFLGYVGRPYQTSDLFRNVAFGTTIGSITGMCFGFMDSIRLAQSSEVLKSASRSAQGKFVFQGTYRSGMFFGGFFGTFHAVKYGTRVLVDPGDAGEILLGGSVALGGILAKREWRASLPYAVMLVAMDSVHVLMREDGKV
ncbi:hypothetical protein ACHAXA_002137 [Cyclostephanos tholiformis]|uniref:Mitochondrial import inner membrane translocase subunit TIM22 n=1 Tax=Cyclostephanos tholiformis TaxID=382380 RepID=A0ABD3RR49_9STRA